MEPHVLHTLGALPRVPAGLQHVKLHLVETFEEARQCEEWFLAGPMQHGVMGVDTESTGLSRFDDDVRLVQVGDLEHGWAMEWDRWSGLFQDFARRFMGTIPMFNAIFDFSMIQKMGITLNQRQIVDTQSMTKLLEPHKFGGLKGAASRHIDPAAGAAQKNLERAIKEQGWDGIDIRFGPYWQYAALDPVLTAFLYGKLAPRFQADEILAHGLDVENSVLWVLNKMMNAGMPVDVAYAQEQKDKIAAYSAHAYQWCVSEYGVKPGSNAAVIQRLQQDGVEFSKVTESGAMSLDKEVLGGIDHPLAQTVLRRRQLDKLSSTYLDHYIANHRGGRVYPSINSTGARTGRMSVANPNFQNLPRVSEANKAASVIRNCIAFQAGHVGLFCDFAQIETRLLAHLSQDPGLIAAFWGDEDFFVTLARQVFKDPTITKKSPKRNVIKTWVYATIYGAGVEKQAKSAGVTYAEMVDIAANIYREFPGIKRFQDHVQTTARQRLRDEGEAYYICPLSGRRHVADLGQEYALVNYLIQGMAAFFFKRKLLELDAAGLGEYMILPVHDEIILEVPIEKAEWAAGILMKIMNDNDTFTVPVEAEVSYGYRWGEKRSWDEWAS